MTTISSRHHIFIHRSFAEFASLYLFQSTGDETILRFIFEHVLNSEACVIIRSLLNGLMTNDDSAFQRLALPEDPVALSVACTEGHDKILRYLLRCMNCHHSSDYEFLFTKYWILCTLLHLAVMHGHEDVAKLLEYPKDSQVVGKMLTVKNNFLQTCLSLTFRYVD